MDFYELLANVFGTSDYEGDTTYESQYDYSHSGLSGGYYGWQNDEDLLQFHNNYADELYADYGVEILSPSDFGNPEEYMEYIQGGYGDDYDYWTDEIGNFMSGYLEDYASGMAEGQIWWDWKDEYGKYFQPYNTRKENILQEITDEKITGLVDDYGNVNRMIASNLGLTNLDSGRMHDLWGGAKDSLQNKINIAELEEDLGIESLRNAYERGFYNTAIELGGLIPGMMNPDAVDTDD